MNFLHLKILSPLSLAVFSKQIAYDYDKKSFNENEQYYHGTDDKTLQPLLMKVLQELNQILI